jgi:4'-phosphopantetheinyl transferase
MTAPEAARARGDPAPLGGPARVFLASLDVGAGAAGRLSALLSAEERDRAARLRRAVDRERFVASHAALRLLLGRAVGADPAALRFCEGARGKPALEDGSLEFSMSHSARIAVYAIARGRRVGVDVEEVREGFDDLAAAHFGPREAAEIAATPGPARAEAFFRTWTLKEAYLKATGDGLSVPLASFAVRPSPRGRAERLAARPGWRLWSFRPAPGYVGALAVEQAGERA